MQLQLTGRIIFPDTLLSTDIRDLHIAETSSGTFLYVTTGPNGGLTSFRLGDEGALAQRTDSVYFSSSVGESVSGDLAFIETGGQSYITIGGADGAGIAAYSVSHTGNIGGTTTLVDLPGAQNIEQYVHISLNDVSYFYATGDGELTGARLNGNQTTEVSINGNSSNAAADGAQIAVYTVDGNPTLLMADSERQGIVSYEIDDQNGNLTQSDSLGAMQGIGIQNPTDLAVANVDGSTYVLAAAAGSHSITVMRLESDGGLTATDHLIDSRETRFGDVNALATVAVESRVFVLAGGGDDGISLFTLLPGGTLLHLDTIAHSSGLGLENIGDIAATLVGNELQLFVSSSSDQSLTQLSTALPELGTVIQNQSSGAQLISGTNESDILIGKGSDTLSGDGGDDILVASSSGESRLRGGSGYDIFVLRSGANTTEILDYTIGQDRIDLSALPMLRNPSQLRFTQTNNGGRIEFGEFELLITTTGGPPLTLELLFGTEFEWPDRSLVLADDGEGYAPDDPPNVPDDPDTPPDDPPDAPDEPPDDDHDPNTGSVDDGDGGSEPKSGQSFTASNQGGYLSGTDGSDTFTGAAGPDNIWAQEGNDTIEGGAGNDTLGGGTGRDSLIGGNGNDVLFGGDGYDTQEGGDGNDQIWGGLGNDLLIGGGGNDSLGGSLDNDTVLGDAGHDLIFGDYGNDYISGGDGDDVLWAGPDHDISYGNNGHDTMGGGTGRDTIFGNFGHDLIYGGDGNDELDGGGGTDTIYSGYDDDFLSGGDGDDILSAGFGNDTLVGGNGNDVFGFGLDQGHDVITDFTPGQDRMDLYLGAFNFNNLTVHSDAQGNAVIVMGTGRIILTGVSSSSLDESDFNFL